MYPLPHNGAHCCATRSPRKTIRSDVTPMTRSRCDDGHCWAALVFNPGRPTTSPSRNSLFCTRSGLGVLALVMSDGLAWAVTKTPTPTKTPTGTATPKAGCVLSTVKYVTNTSGTDGVV